MTEETQTVRVIKRSIILRLSFTSKKKSILKLAEDLSPLFKEIIETALEKGARGELIIKE